MMTLLTRLAAFAAIVSGGYRSFKSLSTAGQRQSEPVDELMKYWSVLAFFVCYEMYIEFVISWLPFYTELKLAMLVGLMVPSLKGASWLFDRVVEPAMDFHRRNLSPHLRRFSARLLLHSLRLWRTVALHASPAELDATFAHASSLADRAAKARNNQAVQQSE